MDGFEVTRRSMGRMNTHIDLRPDIFSYRMEGKEDRIREIEAGLMIFISKPVDKMELLARVQVSAKVKGL